MSVGCEFQYRTETICDESVHIIHTAYLEQISLVKAGAIEKAFAVRAKPDRPLSEDCHTGSLASDGAYVQFIKKRWQRYVDPLCVCRQCSAKFLAPGALLA